MKLLSKPTTNYKANKNIKLGYHTYFLSLAHSDISGYNVCPMANKLKANENNKNKSSCSSVCVGYNGFANIYKSIMKARIRKTKLFFEDRNEFMKLLIKDIQSAIKSSTKKGLIPTFRLNAYSDIKWENIKVIRDGIVFDNIFEIFPDIKFYDYTKISNRITPSNYELTYSYYGNKKALNNEINNKNVAIVFDLLPKKYKNKIVIDGDKTDLRLKDNDGKNVIVGLKFKGSKKALQNGINEGFVIPAGI
tara:strand:- start:1578 stop:2324 length:747 start_codon:yes stop_codon:yes gene_type:complete